MHPFTVKLLQVRRAHCASCREIEEDDRWEADGTKYLAQGDDHECPLPEIPGAAFGEYLSGRKSFQKASAARKAANRELEEAREEARLLIEKAKKLLDDAECKARLAKENEESVKADARLCYWFDNG